MQYKFGEAYYYRLDGSKQMFPSIVHLENDSKYGTFFGAEVNHIGLDYAEEIVVLTETALSFGLFLLRRLERTTYIAQVR